MPPVRRFVALACTGALAAPAVAHAQGSAGDDQYQDPFGAAKSSKTSSAARKRPPRRSSGGLSQTPNLGTPTAPSRRSTTTRPSTAAAAPATSTAPAGTSSSRSQLPKTGTDPREAALAGLALLLCGIGLRLRTADERF
jgi:LPXTG-motif cell wall-anchored protein